MNKLMNEKVFKYNSYRADNLKELYDLEKKLSLALNHVRTLKLRRDFLKNDNAYLLKKIKEVKL